MVLEKAELDQGTESTNRAPVNISCPIAGCFLDFLLLLCARKDALEGDDLDFKQDEDEKFSSETKRMTAAQKHFRQLECIRYGTEGCMMGLSSAITANEGFQLCVFDMRRGQQEGKELDKILFYFPANSPFSNQLSVIGLSEGLITFTRIFSPESACEVIEAEKRSHVLYQAEPDIWMVMVVEKNMKSEGIWRVDELTKVLKEAHSLFVMFHGSLRALIEKDASGGIVPDFIVGNKVQLPSFHDCLKERGTVQMLTVGREAAIAVQSLVGMMESLCVGNTACDSLVLFQDLLVSTTLSPDDTVNLFTYAVMRLTPHALSSSTNSWSYLRKSTVSQVSTGSVPLTVGSAPEEFYASGDTSDNSSLRYHVPRPLRLDNWTKGKDGFLVCETWAAEVANPVSTTPTLLLQKTGERVYLCVYQHKNLTIILLIPVNSVISGDQWLSIIKQQLLENVSDLCSIGAFHRVSLKISKVEERLTRGWGGENAYHVKGYRYLLVDSDRSISRTSPPGKVTTLSKDSLLALTKLREEVDIEKKRKKDDDPQHDKDLEVCIRAGNNAWVIARLTRGKELYMVLEKANETLLYAADAVEKFSSSNCALIVPSFSLEISVSDKHISSTMCRYCDGVFSLD
ncbi:hypothetical protein Sjap_014775 [Stephania japonica]|uniref:CCZ1/INTU/HSP4 first Longin domain-containing protein n=1 Tax=Stephania japonica TaxID=461633 RepID=A0AAP0II11_9MAGN